MAEQLPQRSPTGGGENTSEPGLPGLDLLLLKLLEQTPSSITVVDEQHRILFINHPVPGLTQADVLGKSVHDFILPAYRELARQSIEHVFRTGKAAAYVSQATGPEGGVACYENQLGPIAVQGRVRAVSLIGTDITECNQAEGQLREREGLLSALVETSRDWIWSIDVRGVHTYSNPAVEQILGYPPGQLLGRSSLELMHEEDRQHVEAQLARWIATKSGWRNQLIRWRHRDGSTRYLESNAVPILDPDGHLLGFRGVDRDVTERRQAEERRVQLEQQLLQAQKMEAIGNLAGGIAHDFNNLLTGILGYANLLRLETRPESETHEAAQVIESAAQRAAELTGQLLGFARRGKLREMAVDLHQIVRETVSLLARTIDKRIKLVIALDADRFGVRGDPGQLQQVVMNLAVNARDAMPDGGELSFSTAIVQITERANASPTAPAPGEYVTLCVSDTGVGVPEHLRARIFEPFFTTKPKDQGSGMGLAMVHGIVRNHGGTVRLHSQEGMGTTFEVYLPLDQTVEQPLGAQQPAALARGQGLILVVDDERAVRLFCETVLRSLGYEVISVPSGAEALEQFRAHADSIDLVILDIAMSEMDGRECFRKLQQLRPEVRVLVVTGHALEGAPQALLDMGARAVLSKPFVLGELSEAVARALEPAPGS